VLLPGFGRNGRGIAFLVSGEDKHCDGINVYNKLKKGAKKSAQRAVFTAFDAWLDHHDSLTHRFHGWPNHPVYKGCFTFKWHEGNSGQRFYGFLHNADDYEKGFQLCVLILHAKKNERQTDTAELDRVVDRRGMLEISTALQDVIIKLKKEG